MILIVGDGMVATNLKNSFDKVGINYKITSRKVDLATLDYVYLDISNQTTYSNLDKINYEYVVFTVAISDPVYCQRNPEEAQSTNVIFTENIISYFLEKSKKVIFLSSDVVYGGGEVVYDERRIENPKNVYGRNKLEIENKFILNENFKTFRLSFVVAKDSKFFKLLTDFYSKNEELVIWHPYFRNMIVIDDISKAIENVIKNWADMPFQKINLVGSELLSKWDLAEGFRQKFNDFKILKEITPIGFQEIIAEKIEVNSLFLNNLLGRETIKVGQYLNNNF